MLNIDDLSILQDPIQCSETRSSTFKNICRFGSYNNSTSWGTWGKALTWRMQSHFVTYIIIIMMWKRRQSIRSHLQLMIFLKINNDVIVGEAFVLLWLQSWRLQRREEFCCLFCLFQYNKCSQGISLLTEIDSVYSASLHFLVL